MFETCDCAIVGAIAARQAGASVLPYRTDGPDAVGPQAAALDEGAHLAAIVLCNPGNPDGNVLSARALAGIADRAARDGAMLIVDECYVDLWLDNPIDTALGLVKQASLPELHLAVLHTLSKRSAAPGLRSGFLADITVFDRPLASATLLATKVDMTIVEGRIVFERTVK